MVSDHSQSSDQPKTSTAATNHDQGRNNVDQISSMMAAQEALAENDMSAEHMLYARRYASEAAARTMAGEDAVDLDAFVRKREITGFQGDNFPTYDITSRTEVASVKTHWNADGELNASAMAAYKRDFSKMMGWGRGADDLETDAGNILAVRDAKGPVPAALEQADKAETAEYLRDNARLRVPDDHVPEIRKVLEKDIRALPGNYYLPENPSQEQVEHVLNRVQGIGITSVELRKLIDARMSGNGK